MFNRPYEEIKQGKFFYRNAYRRSVGALLISITITIFLLVTILFLIATEPEQTFYATSGETAPVKLQPLSAPNQSSTPLLPNDPPDDMAKEFELR